MLLKAKRELIENKYIDEKYNINTNIKINKFCKIIHQTFKTKKLDCNSSEFKFLSTIIYLASFVLIYNRDLKYFY